jgi:hypothetical protein
MRIETTDLWPILVIYTYDSHCLFLQPSSGGDETGPYILIPLSDTIGTSHAGFSMRLMCCLGRVPGNQMSVFTTRRERFLTLAPRRLHLRDRSFRC